MTAVILIMEKTNSASPYPLTLRRVSCGRAVELVYAPKEIDNDD